MVQKTCTLALLCAHCFPYTYFHAINYPAFTYFHISIYLPCRIVSLAVTVQLDREVLQQLLLSQYRMLMISVLSLLCRSTGPLYSKTLYRYCVITNPKLQNHASVIGDYIILKVTIIIVATSLQTIYFCPRASVIDYWMMTNPLVMISWGSAAFSSADLLLTAHWKSELLIWRPINTMACLDRIAFLCDRTHKSIQHFHLRIQSAFYYNYLIYTLVLPWST